MRTSRARRGALAGALVLGGLLGCGVSSATPARPADPAEQWFARGIEAARAGDLISARRAFGAAYALVPSVDILWNLATTERKLDESGSALEHLRTYLASPDARPDRRKLAEEEMLPALELATGHLVIAEAEGAVVHVDGKQVAASTTLDLSPGVHAVTLRRDGLLHSFAVDTPAGVVTHLPAEAPPRPAVAGPVPVPALLASSPSSPSTASRTPTVLVLGGAAVLSLAAGIYFSFAARDDQETSDRLLVRMRGDDLSCRRSGSLCDDYESARSGAQRNALLGTSLLVGGGLLAGAAVVSWVLWPAPATRVAPAANKDSASVMIFGRF